MSNKKTPTPAPKTIKIARDAGSGQFVTKAYADTHKKTTTVETRPARSSIKKSKR